MKPAGKADGLRPSVVRQATEPALGSGTPWDDAALAATPIREWPADAKRIAGELGKHPCFIRAMQRTTLPKQVWLAQTVAPVVLRPEELSAGLILRELP